MASTFTCLDCHVVFSTKYRRNTIVEEFREELYQYIGGIIRSKNGCLREINGMPDHVHFLVGIPPTIAVSDLIRIIKANSSKWLNERPSQARTFRWQTGYGAFSVSASQLASVREYIQSQEKHHRQRTFKDEFVDLLKRHNIEFDPNYAFEDEHVA